MNQRTRQQGPGTYSVPADVTAAMAGLRDALAELAETVDPSVMDLVADATGAAAVVIEGLMDMAADAAVPA